MSIYKQNLANRLEINGQDQFPSNGPYWLQVAITSFDHEEANLEFASLQLASLYN